MLKWKQSIVFPTQTLVEKNHCFYRKKTSLGGTRAPRLFCSLGLSSHRRTISSDSISHTLYFSSKIQMELSATLLGLQGCFGGPGPSDTVKVLLVSHLKPDQQRHFRRKGRNRNQRRREKLMWSGEVLLIVQAGFGSVIFLP